ncbi:phenylalanyl-tRNA synthetase alpha subunit [Prauserella sediminis]|uniref:Phenylalanyl-tRNA synthetase alpha subunit n=1 Tax=Prauserella sediminis TaxID=577680 RepID=A0A839XLG2_9PSEU|nr:hypothetical protein [Prauserella sediminis]MBB3662669.1 phenylalanyl-tRNA synthetase alpha subunit [Prauserella sediminis]
MTRTAEAGESVKDRLTEGTDEVVKSSRRAQKKLAAQAKKARKEVSKSAKKAKQVADERRDGLTEPTRKAKKAAVKAAKAAGESKRRAKKDFKAAKKDFKVAMKEAKGAAAGAETGEKKKRKKLPILLGIAVIAGVAYALRPKPETPVAPAPPQSTDNPETGGVTGNNGQTSATPQPKKA